MNASNKYLLYWVLVIALFFSSNFSNAAIEEEIKRPNFTVNFFNATDHPPTLPYMSLRFENISEKDKEKVSQWRDEIDKRLREMGGVYKEEDYDKVTKVLPDYVKRFIATDSRTIYITFPRQKRGILLFQKK